MATANYKKPNPNLERLISLLGIAKPSHGYTVAEQAPEVVTAPGVYFPAESGEVVPLKPPSIPGLPKAPTARSYSMLPEASKLGGSNFMWQDKYIPRQGGGDVYPTATTMRRKQGEGFWQADIGDEPLPPQPTSELTPQPKKEPDIIDKLVDFLRPTLKLYSRQMGGETDPTLFSKQGGGRVFPAMPEEEELLARQRWEVPGYPEEALAKARGELGPNVVGVTPGFQRSYYEARPEERIMDLIAQENKPAIDAMQKALEGARSREQGFGLMGLNRRGTREARLQASKDIPTLTQALSQTVDTGKATGPQYLKEMTPDVTKPPAPHLVQNAAGEYVWATPGGVLPAGIMGKATQPRSMTSEELVRGDLKLKLKRDPTEGEVLDEMDRRKLNLQMGGIPPMSPESMKVPTMTGVKNETALEGLTPEQQSVVKKLASYELPIPGSFAMKDPKWQALLGRTAAYDPSFDATQYNVRQKLRQDFTSGKAANNIRSLNTAVAHLDTLSKKAGALSNAPVQIWNAIKNKGLTAVGDKRVTEFNNAATAVESELANVFKGMGASDQEIKAWRANLSTSQSPEQLNGAISTAIELLGGRLGALQAQYETGLGRPKDFTFLSPKSRTILQGLGANVDMLDTSTGKSEEKTVVKKFVSPSTGKTKYVYSDGTEEIR